MEELVREIAGGDRKKEKQADKAFGLHSPEHQYYYLWDVYQGKCRNPGTDARSYFLDSPFLSESKQKVEAMIELFTQSQEIVEGVYKCSNCQSRKTLSMNKQVRSADENTNNQIICATCGNSWNE